MLLRLIPIVLPRNLFHQFHQVCHTEIIYEISYRLRSQLVTNPLNLRADYPVGFQWLQDSQPIRGYAEPEVYQYYGFRIETQCTRFAVSIQKNSTLLGDADLYMSVDNKPIGFGQTLDARRDWLSNNDGDDVISIYYCHDSSPPFTMFMAVTAYDVSVGYDIIATTRKYSIFEPRRFEAKFEFVQKMTLCCGL